MWLIIMIGMGMEIRARLDRYLGPQPNEYMPEQLKNNERVQMSEDLDRGRAYLNY